MATSLTKLELKALKEMCGLLKEIEKSYSVNSDSIEDVLCEQIGISTNNKDETETLKKAMEHFNLSNKNLLKIQEIADLLNDHFCSNKK